MHQTINSKQEKEVIVVYGQSMVISTKASSLKEAIIKLSTLKDLD